MDYNYCSHVLGICLEIPGERGYALAGGRVLGTLGTELRVPTARNLHFIKTSRANRTAAEPGLGIIFALNPLRLIVPRSVIAFRTLPCKETIITMTFESELPRRKRIRSYIDNPPSRRISSDFWQKPLPIPSTVQRRQSLRDRIPIPRGYTHFFR